MAGTIPLSMTQQFDQFGEPLSGGKLYGIQAATVSTPQNFFQDINLALPWPNPITLDAAGRIPQLFIADGLIKIRLTDAAGVVQLVADNIQVVGSSSGGGGGGGTIDPLTIFMTGDVKARYGTGVHPGTLPGWVRCNGLTIGAAGSGATELPHANCQPLFEYLWGADTSLAVSGGRGANAHGDWLAGKQLALPDMRARLLTGLADMGNVNNNILASTPFTRGNATTLGSLFGNVSHIMTLAEMWQHRHGVFLNDPQHNHTGHTTGSQFGGTGGSAGVFGGTLALTSALTIDNNSTGITIWDAPGISGLQNATAAVGGNTGSTAFDITNPAMLVTFYMKL